MAAIALASSAISAYGSMLQGQTTANSLNAQANLQLQNAKEAEEQGQYNATRQSMISNQKIGNAVANYGASGVTSSSGSVMAVLQNSAANAELDRLNILHGADVRAINYENQASLDKMGANSAIQAGFFGAFGSAGSGAMNMYGRGMSSSPPSANGTDPIDSGGGGGSGALSAGGG